LELTLEKGSGGGGGGEGLEIAHSQPLSHTYKWCTASASERQAVQKNLILIYTEKNRVVINSHRNP